MGGEKTPLEMSELGCADGCGREMGVENCADSSGRRGCNGVAGNGWGEEAAGDERAWLRGRLRTGNGCRELRGRLRMAWVQGSGWKWVGNPGLNFYYGVENPFCTKASKFLTSAIIK